MNKFQRDASVLAMQKEFNLILAEERRIMELFDQGLASEEEYVAAMDRSEEAEEFYVSQGVNRRDLWC